MKSLIILGISGSAYDILDIVYAQNVAAPTWRVMGFLDDGRCAGTPHLGCPVLGALHDAGAFGGSLFINAIGSDASYTHRAHILAATGLKPDRFATLVHPQASVSPHARLGRGVYVSFGASIGGGVVVGDHVSFSPSCTVGHDSVIEDYALIAPGAVISGFVRVGRSSYVGASSCIRQRVTLGAGCLVGMGAVVLQDVAPGETVVGNPARVLRRTGQKNASEAALLGNP